MHVFADDELQPPIERCLDRGLIDFAVSLGGVPVANLEQRATYVHGDEQRGDGHELPVVQIARVDPRWGTADSACSRGWRHTHAPEEGSQGNLDSRREYSDHSFFVQGNDAGSLLTAIVPDEPATPVVAVRNLEPDRDDPHLQYVTLLGSLHVDGSGQDMAARSTIGHLVDDVAERLLYLVGRHSRGLEPVRAVGDHRDHVDHVT